MKYLAILTVLGCTNPEFNPTPKHVTIIDQEWSGVVDEAAALWGCITISDHGIPIHYLADEEWPEGSTSLGIYLANEHQIWVRTGHRTRVGILRTTAHEIGHWLGLSHNDTDASSIMGDGLVPNAGDIEMGCQ